MKIKLPRNATMLVVILYTLLSLIAVSFGYYQTEQQEIHRVSRSLYNTDSLYFTVKSGVEIDWSQLDVSQPFTVFRELGLVKDREEWLDVRGVYYHHNTYRPPMISGRFFEESDFYKNKRIAIIGKNVARQTDNYSERDGKAYYWFQGMDFEITGTMGASYSSKLDNAIFFNMDAIGRSGSEVYVMNIAENPISPDGSLKFKNNTVVSVYAFDRGDSGAARYINSADHSLRLFVAVALLMASSGFLFANYWIKEKDIEIKVLWQSGIPIRSMCLKFAGTYILAACLSYLSVGVTGCLFLTALGIFRSSAWLTFASYLIFGFGLLLLSSAPAIWVSIHSLVKPMVWKGIQKT